MTFNITNKFLLQRIAISSDKETFSELFKKFHSKMVLFGTCILPGYNEAGDIVSEEFGRLLHNNQEPGK